MFRTLLKLGFLAAVAYGVYHYVIADPLRETETVDVPAVAYKDVPSVEFIPKQTEEVPEPEVVVPEVVPSPLPESIPTDVPARFNLAVPFTSQAPHANWELPYQEACEEASAYMVAQYYAGASAGNIDPNVADAALLEVVEFEKDFLGDYLDTTAAQTAQFIDNFYGLHARVIENPSVEDIKREIAAGRPVIVPAAGRQLGNPHFSGLGPLYHMLVIKGYTETQFITNDPGTRFGEGFVYEIGVIMEAMGDWNNGDPATGAKRVIFVDPEFVPVGE